MISLATPIDIIRKGYKLNEESVVLVTDSSTDKATIGFSILAVDGRRKAYFENC